jgi:hypothetical protein
MDRLKQDTFPVVDKVLSERPGSEKKIEGANARVPWNCSLVSVLSI